MADESPMADKNPMADESPVAYENPMAEEILNENTCVAVSNDGCNADWGLIGQGLSGDQFAGLGPEARRMALIERSARFAVEFGKWKDTGRSGGLGFEHMRLLQSLSLDGPVIMREIGDKLLITPRNMTAMVDQLEAAELVVRRPHPADRRATILELTPAGRETANQALMPRFIAMGKIFDQLSDEEQQTFNGALCCLINVMHGDTS
jgi:DNA-binding MarR family transcriptional regulator